MLSDSIKGTVDFSNHKCFGLVSGPCLHNALLETILGIKFLVGSMEKVLSFL